MLGVGLKMGVCREFPGAGVATLEHTSKYTQKYTPEVLREWLQRVKGANLSLDFQVLLFFEFRENL